MNRIETSRLYLRERTPDLIERVKKMPKADQMAFFGFEDAFKLERTLKRADKDLPMRYWELLTKDDTVVGNAGFHTWYPEHDRAEIGYGLFPAHQKKGYMREALEAVISIGFGEMQLNRIEAFVSPTNEPSKAIMSHFGFAREGLLRQHYKHKEVLYDSEVYGLLKEEYLVRAKAL